MYQFEVNDLVICKPEEEKRCKGNQEFEIYARVVEVIREENKIKLDKYQRNGAFSCSSDRYLPLDECENKLYQPMNDKEVLLFYTGLEVLDSLPRWKKSAETDNTIECVQEKATEILAQMKKEKDVDI